MRLHEITASPSYYTATTQALKRGAILRVPGTVHPLGAFLEGRLEAVRPDDRLSRQTSIYLHEHEAVTGCHIYEVQPLGEVFKHHTSWLRQLTATSTGSVGALDHFCHAYWSGKECPEERELPWEHRTSEVKIVRRVGGSAVGRVDGSAA